MDLQVFEYNEIDEHLKVITDELYDINVFFDSHTYEDVIKKKEEKNNTKHIFKNYNSNNEMKSKITQIYNKLNSNNIDILIEEVKKINFKTMEDFLLMVELTYNKLRNINDNSRQYLGLFCYKLMPLYFNDENKTLFITLLKNKIKEDYDLMLEYNKASHNEEEYIYNINTYSKLINIITLFYEMKIINKNIIEKIILDYKQIITNNEDYMQINYIGLQFCNFITLLNKNEILKELNIKEYLEEQLLFYNNKISKKTIIFINQAILNI